jgi:tetratricopeptide (TPR) repeat protein
MFCRHQSKSRHSQQRIATAIGLLAILWSCVTGAEAYRPTDPDVVLARVPVHARSVGKALTPLKAFQQAQRELTLGRTTLDERHFGRARAVLEAAVPCLREEPADRVAGCAADQLSIDLLITYADVLQRVHRFDAAVRALDASLRLEPRNSQARLMRAAIRLAQGDPRTALKDCTALVGSTSSMAATACIAQSIALTGRLDDAQRLLSEHLINVETGGESMAWAWSIFSELNERRGDFVGAIESMREAIHADPENGSLRLQAADLMLRANRPMQAREMIERLPDVEPVILRRALAANIQGSSDSNELAMKWRSLTDHAERLARPIHLRDAAVAELRLFDRPERALRYALANWNESKDIEDARLRIACAQASFRPEAAQPVWAWIDALNIQDVAIDKARAGRVR